MWNGQIEMRFQLTVVSCSGESIRTFVHGNVFIKNMRLCPAGRSFKVPKMV